MDVKKEFEKIEEHFKNLTVEEFEENLVECGIEVIMPSSESGWELV